MKVASRHQVVMGYILEAQLGDCAQIGEDVALAPVGQNERNSRLGAMCDVLKIHTEFSQPFNSEVSEGVVADLGDESHATAEGGEIMCQNSRGTAQGHGEVARQQLAFRGHVLRQAVEDQIKI